MRGAWSVLAILALTGTAAPAQPSCPGTATLTVFAENLSAASTIDVALEGELAADAATCVGTGATSYRETMACMGSGTVRCGQLGALQPGAWVHRLAVTVPGSAPQQQAQRLVLVAGSPTEASNALSWTIYPKTFVVEDTTETSLRAQLAAAAAYPGPTLVTFARTAFPGRSASRTIDLARGPCDPEPLRHAALCFTGSRVVVDALDADGEPGAVVWSVGTRALSLLRVYGSDNVFRGLLFEGSRTQQNSAQPTCPYAPAQPTCPDPTRPNCPDPAKPDCPITKPDCQVDTVAISGSKARRNRIEHSLVVGPTCGDALSVDSDAGQPDDQGPGDNVIVESRITGAADRGVKVDFGGFATIERSCLHDNRNGGILSTLGGHVVAAENVVQHNVPGRAQNGITVGGPAPQSTLATDGNVVRLSGDRGLSVVNNASATFQNDYVADSQFAGSKVETTADGAADATPVATFHGVALVCNRHGNLTGTCTPSPCDCELPVPCSTKEDCCTNPDGTLDTACETMTKCEPGSLPRGAGAVTAAAPNVSYGDALEPGRNAFAAKEGVDGRELPGDERRRDHTGRGEPVGALRQRGGMRPRSRAGTGYLQLALGCDGRRRSPSQPARRDAGAVPRQPRATTGGRHRPHFRRRLQRDRRQPAVRRPRSQLRGPAGMRRRRLVSHGPVRERELPMLDREPSRPAGEQADERQSHPDQGGGRYPAGRRHRGARLLARCRHPDDARLPHAVRLLRAARAGGREAGPVGEPSCGDHPALRPEGLYGRARRNPVRRRERLHRRRRVRRRRKLPWGCTTRVRWSVSHLRSSGRLRAEGVLGGLSHRHLRSPPGV